MLPRLLICCINICFYWLIQTVSVNQSYTHSEYIFDMTGSIGHEEFVPFMSFCVRTSILG